MSQELAQVSEAVHPLLAGDGEGPDAKPIVTLHRGSDGYVTFHRKVNGVWEDLFAVRADEIPTLFPSFRAELERDSYFSVNAFYRHGRKSRKVPGAWLPCRRQEALRCLCVCYVDLDSYNVGLEIGGLVGAVVSMQDNGVIPPASLMSRSGRGLWLFWLLRDVQHPDGPPRAWPETLALYFRIQRAIHERLAPFGSDGQARDAVRVTRVPGSMHSGANRRVAYWLQADAQGQTYLYTLDGLAQFLRLETPRTSRESLHAGSRVNKRRGWLALYALRLHQFECLRAMRGGFREGCRNHAALLYAHFLKKTGKPDEVIHKSVFQFAGECRPPLSKRECGDAIKSGINPKMRRIKDRTIADWLGITPEEAPCLETWRPASQSGPPSLPPADAVSLTLSEKVQARRRAIAEIIHASGAVPSVREMSNQLASRGISGGRDTVARDYKALGVVSDWEKRAEGNRAARKRQGRLLTWA